MGKCSSNTKRFESPREASMALATAVASGGVIEPTADGGTQRMIRTSQLLRS
jgi:hypothetical protein